MKRFTRWNWLLAGTSLSLALSGQSSCESEDADGDDWTTSEGDCDDDNSDVYPEAAEICDGLDNDCDGDVDGLQQVDADLDGFSATPDYLCGTSVSLNGTRGDCDDTDPDSHPGAADAEGDGIDQDCGGSDGSQPHVGYGESSAASISEAIALASDGDIIWIGPGEYKERNISILGKSITIMSSHFASNTTLNAEMLGSGFCVRDVVMGEVVIDGLSLINLDSIDGVKGNAVDVLNSKSEIRNSNISNISAVSVNAYGGLIAGENSSIVVDNCDFVDNNILSIYVYYSDLSVVNTRSLGRKSAVYGSNSAVSLSHVEVANANDDVLNAGVSVTEGTLRIIDSYIHDNGFTMFGGVYVSKSIVDIERSLFERNSGTTNGALITVTSSVRVFNSIFRHNMSELCSALYLDANIDAQVLNTSFVENAGTPLYINSAYFQAVPARIENNLFAGNSAQVGAGGVLLTTEDLDTPTLSGSITNSIFAYNVGFNILVAESVTIPPTVEYNSLYSESGANTNVLQLSETNLEVEPGFVSYPTDGVENLHLSLSSPLINMGDPELLDVDGTRSDIGLYGGELGNGIDADLDGSFDYFWPGTLDDAPSGYDPADYDKNDQDATVQ